MKRYCLLLAVLLAGCAHPPVTSTGIDPKNFDPTVKPQDDFYLYANGGWMKANAIPPEYGSWDAWAEVDNRNKAELRTILESSAASPGADPIKKMVGDFYASGMDEAAIKTAGLTPLQPELDRLAAMKTSDDLQAEIAHFHRLRIFPGFYFSSEEDPKNSALMIAGTEQGGLGLPDRDYYFRDDDKSKKLREQYVTHIVKMFELAGDAPAAAEAGAASVLKLETALAQDSKSRVDLRDPVANYHKMPLADLQKLTPHFDWAKYCSALDLKAPDVVDVGQPVFFTRFDAVLDSTSLDDWRAYLRWNLLNSCAQYLSPAWVEEDFNFSGRILTGVEQLHERWRRVLGVEDRNLGEAMGRLFVAQYFPPASKARMLELVGNLRAVLRARLATLEWMDEPTRAAALKKLDAFNVKIGYPDKWRDYSKLVIDRGPYVLNVLRAREFESHRELAQIGQPTDRTEWGMTPPTVNAYFDASNNEVVFPAGILQPPFFDPAADDALNYGAIGMVIGHEMTHGYDDQGRQFDWQGNLHDWWSVDSATRFKTRSTGIVRQFDGYVAVDDLHVKGELTQGENIADLGGLKLSFAALQKDLAGKPVQLIDGFTPEQRFFLGFAAIWRANVRPEFARLRALTDPHSPPHWRVNGPLSNLPEFWAAFNVPEGAPMRRTEADRVSIW